MISGQPRALRPRICGDQRTAASSPHADGLSGQAHPNPAPQDWGPITYPVESLTVLEAGDVVVGNGCGAVRVGQ